MEFKYSIGDPAYVLFPRSWGVDQAKIGTVKKITPSGQIVVDMGHYERRFNARGRLVGASGYRSECLIDKARYDETLIAMEEESLVDAAHRALRKVGDMSTDRNTKTEILEAIEAARITVEKLP